jgi:hypothetical protein
MAMFLLFARHLRQAKMERVHCVIRGHAHKQVGPLLPLPSIPAFHGFFGDRFGVLPLTSGFKCIVPPFPPAPVHIVEGCWWQRSCPYAAVTGCWRHIPCKYEICDIRFARFSRPLSVRLSRHFAAVALGCVQVFLYVHQTSELARRPVAPEGLLQRSAHALDRCRRRAWTPTSASAH